MAYSASEYRGSAARHSASGSPISLRTMFVPSTIATILYCAWRRLMPSRPIPQSPSLSLSAPTNSPLQEQMREDYATGLMGAQRERLQQNPSGLGRQEQEIGRELNGYTPR